jgi:hypothetical protein
VQYQVPSLPKLELLEHDRPFGELPISHENFVVGSVTRPVPTTDGWVNKLPTRQCVPVSIIVGDRHTTDSPAIKFFAGLSAAPRASNASGITLNRAPLLDHGPRKLADVGTQQLLETKR